MGLINQSSLKGVPIKRETLPFEKSLLTQPLTQTKLILLIRKALFRSSIKFGSVQVAHALECSLEDSSVKEHP